VGEKRKKERKKERKEKKRKNVTTGFRLSISVFPC
jgi:hypothetical protein